MSLTLTFGNCTIESITSITTPGPLGSHQHASLQDVQDEVGEFEGDQEDEEVEEVGFDEVSSCEEDQEVQEDQEEPPSKRHRGAKQPVGLRVGPVDAPIHSSWREKGNWSEEGKASLEKFVTKYSKNLLKALHKERRDKCPFNEFNALFKEEPE